MALRGRSPAERSIAERIRTIWSDVECQDLATQLEGAGYRLPFEASAAPLVATLFRDVIKGARYGKTAHKLLEERNAQISHLEEELKRRQAESQEGSVEYKSRLFRLLRLAGSSIYIASRALKISDADDCGGWTSASTDLLSALLSYEKHIDKDPPREGYPAFLSEFHSLWKAIEERDMARSEIREKDDQITILLAGKTNNLLPQLSTTKEEQLFVAVESLKATADLLIGKSTSTHTNGAIQNPTTNEATQQHESAPLLQMLEKTQKQLEEQMNVNRTMESELRRVEKKFASHLKGCCSDESLTRHARSASPALERNFVGDSTLDDSFINQIREDKSRLQASLDARNNDISLLQTEIARLKLEVHEISRKYASAVASDQMNREEMAAMQKRCELFEQEFRCLDERRISDETEIRRLNIDLEDAINETKGHKKTVEDMENAQLRVVAMDRELSSLKESLENANVQVERYEVQKRRLEEQCNNKDSEIAILKNEQDKLKQVCKGMRSDIHQMQLNLARSQDELKNAHVSLRTLSERHQQLKRQADDLMEAETSTLRSKEEAIRDREAYRQAVKENRKEISALKEDCEQLRQRNAFLLKSLEGGYGANDQNYSPSLPPSISYDKCDGDMMRELMDLKRENYVVREKCQGALTMLRNSIETRKELQKEINHLTIQVTALQAELEAAHDELELRGKSVDRPSERSVRTGGSELTSGNQMTETETWPSVGVSYDRTMPTTSRFGTDESGASEPQSTWPESGYTWMPTDGGSASVSQSEYNSQATSAASREPAFDLSLMGRRLPTPPPPNTMGPTPLPARAKSGGEESQSRLDLSLNMKSSFKQRAMQRIAEQTREADEMELKLSQISLQPHSASSVLSPTNYSQYIAENSGAAGAESRAHDEDEDEDEDDEVAPVDSSRSRVSMGYEVDHLDSSQIRDDHLTEGSHGRENDEPLMNSSMGFMTLSKSKSRANDSPISNWTVSRDTERVTLQHSNSADRMISCWDFSDATSYRPQTDRMDYSATPPHTLPTTSEHNTSS